MVPRIHKRGTSFKGATRYVLHDPGKDTDDRVLWTDTANLGDIAPENAWRAMHETWRDRTRLKREAGVDLRGRDNTTPVLHLTLAWALDEKPDEKHMRETARSALKALKLDEHQALIAAHADKEHLHVHLIVNTVHPETGRTAAMKHSKLELSKWAEAYEREHGIKCEQRIQNNEEREQNRRERAEQKKLTPEQVLGVDAPPKPVRDRSPSRDQAIAQRDVVDRMKRLRAELDHRHMVERDVSYSRHRQERAALLQETRTTASGALDHMKERYRPKWRDLLQGQDREAASVERTRDNIFERAVYVFCNSARLGGSKSLSLRQKISLIRSPDRLEKTVAGLHVRERAQLNREQKVETKALLDRVWAGHDRKKTALATQHRDEIAAHRAKAATTTREEVSFTRARDQVRLERAQVIPQRQAAAAPPLETDRAYVARVRAELAAHAERNVPRRSHFAEKPVEKPAALPPPLPMTPPGPQAAPMFERAAEPLRPAPEAAPPALTRSEQIKRDMAEWKKRNPGKDLGREM